MGQSWGFEIRWGAMTVGMKGFPTYEDMAKARDAEYERLSKEGWTQPRWWQFWRSRDTRR